MLNKPFALILPSGDQVVRKQCPSTRPARHREDHHRAGSQPRGRGCVFLGDTKLNSLQVPRRACRMTAWFCNPIYISTARNLGMSPRFSVIAHVWQKLRRASACRISLALYIYDDPRMAWRRSVWSNAHISLQGRASECSTSCSMTRRRASPPSYSWMNSMHW